MASLPFETFGGKMVYNAFVVLKHAKNLLLRAAGLLVIASRNASPSFYRQGHGRLAQPLLQALILPRREEVARR